MRIVISIIDIIIKHAHTKLYERLTPYSYFDSQSTNTMSELRYHVTFDPFLNYRSNESETENSIVTTFCIWKETKSFERK